MRSQRWPHEKSEQRRVREDSPTLHNPFYELLESPSCYFINYCNGSYNLIDCSLLEIFLFNVLNFFWKKNIRLVPLFSNVHCACYIEIFALKLLISVTSLLTTRMEYTNFVAATNLKPDWATSILCVGQSGHYTNEEHG